MIVISAKWFRCPDGQVVEIEQCLKNCMREERCMALPALIAVGRERKWSGKPSVTQLLKPTREMYLLIKNDFAIDPQKKVSAMIGTLSHSIMENNTPIGWLSEFRVEDDICSGQPDAFDLTTGTLWDFKFYGAYRIAIALGYRGKYEYVGEYQKGPNKGKPKFEFVYRPGGVRDVLEVAIQLNKYRQLIEKHNFKVNHMKVQMFVRGGLDKVARSYGLDRISYIVPIYPISDIWVNRFLNKKHYDLMTALDKDILPPVCSEKERWSSKTRPDYKCINYCDANIVCPYYLEKYGGEESGFFIG